MAWILESVLSAISAWERERSLTLEERLMLVMQHGAGQTAHRAPEVAGGTQ
jgi:hypothetical protein